ncbi:pantoate--beta-alanine ligase [Omnitrophica bacterium]|nr:pantoate--beta-alanine ligase [Candidatus Omnitrophota bacterium]
MRVIRRVSEWQAVLKRRKAAVIGLVPTMGALHEGHLSLVRAARKENDVTVVSIFVNPTQFGPKEDLKKYPRSFRQDCAKLKKEKVDYVFYPAAQEVYPEGFKTSVAVAPSADDPLTRSLCGKFRPGHFDGVATVVAKLFNMLKPDTAYFGLKDYQQCAVIWRMVQDLNFGVRLRTLPTVREKDGLAMSSRNAYLQGRSRQRALSLSQVLFWVRAEILSGRRDFSAIRAAALQKLKAGVDRVQYLEFVDPSNLRPLNKFQLPLVALTACYVGKTRLIDNVIITSPQKGKMRQHATPITERKNSRCHRHRSPG